MKCIMNKIIISLLLILIINSPIFCDNLTDDEKIKIILNGYDNARNFYIDKINFQLNQDKFLKIYKNTIKEDNYPEYLKNNNYNVYSVKDVSTSDIVKVSFYKNEVHKIVVIFTFDNIEKNLGGYTVFMVKIIAKFGLPSSEKSNDEIDERVYDFSCIDKNMNRCVEITSVRKDQNVVMTLENTTVGEEIKNTLLYKNGVNIGF